MARIRNITRRVGTDPATGKPVVRRETRTFYQSLKWSTWTMAQGDTGFSFFAGVETDQTKYRYHRGQNMFTTNNGYFLSMRAVFRGAAFVHFDPNGASFDLANLDAYEALVAKSLVSVKVDTKPDHEDSLVNFLPRSPFVFSGASIGTPNNLVRPYTAWDNQDGSGWNRRSGKWGVYWTPPIHIETGRTHEIRVDLIGGASVPAALASHCLTLYLLTEEIPQGNTQELRAGS